MRLLTVILLSISQCPRHAANKMNILYQQHGRCFMLHRNMIVTEENQKPQFNSDNSLLHLATSGTLNYFHTTKGLYINDHH